MTSRDWPSDKAAAFQAVTGGFDSRVPLQFNGIKMIPDAQPKAGEIVFWVMPMGIAYACGDNVP